MYAGDIKVESLADVPYGTDPKGALRAAEALLAYCLQFPDVFPRKELNHIRHAADYVDLVRNPPNWDASEKLQMKMVEK